MKTDYKYIKFVPTMHASGRRCWECQNKKGGYGLGIVDYLSPWKQCVFQPATNTEFSIDCLLVVADFLKQLNEEKNIQINSEIKYARPE